MREEVSDKVQWVLAFDGGCSECSSLAWEIAAISEGKLSARSLQSCEVRRWRDQTLGPDAEWLPTLFAIDGEQTQAWTGRAMAWRLARLLGPGKTSQIFRLLTDLPTMHAIDDLEEATSPSRRRAVKALGGAAVALGLALGKQELLPSAGSGQVATAAQPVWKVAEANRKARRQMENRWRGEELRTFRKWLKEHGYKPDGAAQYTMVKRNGKTMQKTVAEPWVEAGRVTMITLMIGRNGNEEWKGFIHNSNTGKLERRLRLSEARRVVAREERQDQMALNAAGCPSWLWCPDGCSVCTNVCSGFNGVTGGGGLTSCLYGCYSAGGPLAGTVCSVICGGLVLYGYGYINEKGCPWFCETVDLC